MRRSLFALCLALAGLAAGALLPLGCHPKPPPEPAEDEGPTWFDDVTARVGIDFAHDSGGPPDHYFMPQIVGSGSALFDFDGDGLLDLYLIHNGGPNGKKNRLYKQRPDGTFEDVSAGSGLDVAGYGMGAAVGDVNNDGRPDLLLTEYGRVRLFLNQGGGKFKDATREAGLDNPLWATSASFLDYDRDGHLDLFITNYVTYDPSLRCHNANGLPDYCAPKAFVGTASKLFRNLSGEKGTPGGAVRFKDVSFESNISKRIGPGLGVVCADFTGDGWVDVFVANDGAPNHLWVNQLDGTFKEEALGRGVAVNAMGKAEANMGVGWGDVDGDGLQDLFVTHLSNETNTVWKQGPPGQFTDWTVGSAMHRPRWRATGFGTLLADFDNDGALDAAVVNGDVARRPAAADSPLGPFWGRYGQRNQLFRNDGSGRFLDLSAGNKAFCGFENMGRGLAVGDVDNSGALWLVVTGVSDRARVFRNVAPGRGAWLGLRVIDPRYRRDALGAEVTVHAGARRWVRTVHTGGSFLCSNDPRAHFGLGTVEKVDRVVVLWPDGLREEFPGGPVSRYRTLERGRGKPAPKEKKP